MPLRRTILFTMVLLGGWHGLTARAQETNKRAIEAQVQKSLAREIMGSRQALADTIELCREAIPRMPAVDTLDDWEKEAARMRADALDHVIFRGEARSWRGVEGKVEWLETIEGGPGYRIKKVRYEALPGLWIPALWYEPTDLKGKVPVVLNVNGHDAEGKAAGYKQVRCINLAKRGIIALNLEWFGMGQLRNDDFRHDQINHIDLCGTSGIATHYLAMSRGIDLLLSSEHADPARVAVTGLSGGGWQTIFISAFDERVTLTNPVAGYSSFLTRLRYFSDLGDAEQTPCDLATVTDYAQMTAMLAPRAALLSFNAEDNCCFASGHALPYLRESAEPIYRLYGKPRRLRSHVNTDPGTHNYLVDNRQAFYSMVGETFFPNDKAYSWKEVASDDEVKPAEALAVDLPKANLSLHGLALKLSEKLPRLAELPSAKEEARQWRDQGRKRLADVIRLPRYDASVEVSTHERGGPVQVTHWRLKVGPWTVPVTEFKVREPARTVVLLKDEGRNAASGEVLKWLDEGARVLALDPFYFGESRIAERDYLFALMLSTIGERPLGVQAAQIGAVARWARSMRPAEPLTIAANGPRTSVLALASAALEVTSIDEVALNAPLGSLKSLIETRQEYAKSPELFNFGLLQEFDVVQLAALVVPRKLSIFEAKEDARKALGPLTPWYQTWGSRWSPFAAREQPVEPSH